MNSELYPAIPTGIITQRDNMDTIHWTLPWECMTRGDNCGYVKFGIYRESDGQVRPVYEHCDKIDCEWRACRLSWMRRAAEKATVRIAGGLAIWEMRRRNVDLENNPALDEEYLDSITPMLRETEFTCSHYSVSLNEQDWESYASRKNYKKLEKKMRKALAIVGVKGHMEVFHSHRSGKERATSSTDDGKYLENIEELNWEFGPHWHIIGNSVFITKEHREKLKELGVVVKWLRKHSINDTDALYRNIFYELTHAGVPMRPDNTKHGMNLVKWGGGMSKRKLKSHEIDRIRERAYDAETGEDLFRIYPEIIREYEDGKTIYSVSNDTIPIEKYNGSTMGREEVESWDYNSLEEHYTSLPTYEVTHRIGGRIHTIRIQMQQGMIEPVTYKHYSGEMRTFNALVGRFDIDMDSYSSRYLEVERHPKVYW